jgi:rhodanese-related sulfurtransferase
MSSVRQASVDELAAAMAAKGVSVLLDVRTPEEYAGGHVPGARNLPVDQIASRVGELSASKGQEVWVICQSGKRSAMASGALASLGHRPVDVLGGTAAWKNAGKPVE